MPTGRLRSINLACRGGFCQADFKGEYAPNLDALVGLGDALEAKAKLQWKCSAIEPQDRIERWAGVDPSGLFLLQNRQLIKAGFKGWMIELVFKNSFKIKILG